jgi:hypothetical protein
LKKVQRLVVVLEVVDVAEEVAEKDAVDVEELVVELVAEPRRHNDLEKPQRP